MSIVNHYESDVPCFRVAHDEIQVLSVTFGTGQTSTIHQILVEASWEEVTNKLSEQEITLPEEVFIPPAKPEIE